MSTIKTTNLQHPSAGSPNLTLASSGAVAINGSMTGAGLDLITTQSFSAISSLSIDNCFSDNYSQYRVAISGNGSANSVLQLRMRSSGTTYSGSSHTFQQLQVYGTSVAGNRYSSFTQWNVGYADATGTFFDILDFSYPTTSRPVFVIAQGGAQSATGSIESIMTWCTTNQTTSYDGINIFLNTGTMTGSVRVYGYKNS